MSNYQHNQYNLTEGLKHGDLKDFVEPLFTVDQYKSKMGSDDDVIVLSFRVKDKNPAIDLMEFIEKGYPYVLDADISSGEERSGYFSVFVELERNKSVPRQMVELINGISQLSGIKDWRFRYYKDTKSVEFTKENIIDNIPLNKDDYHARIEMGRNSEINSFFDQGALESVYIDNKDNLTIKKTYAESLNAKLLDYGDYDILKESLSGPIQLDKNSISQSIYLQKYLGNYEVSKIDDKFLIKNADKAIIIKKDLW